MLRRPSMDVPCNLPAVVAAGPITILKWFVLNERMMIYLSILETCSLSLPVSIPRTNEWPVAGRKAAHVWKNCFWSRLFICLFVSVMPVSISVVVWIDRSNCLIGTNWWPWLNPPKFKTLGFWKYMIKSVRFCADISMRFNSKNFLSSSLLFF